MKYEKPTVAVAGNAGALVMGTKHELPNTDGTPPDFIVSVNAYEADE